MSSSFSAQWLRGDPRAVSLLADRFRSRDTRAAAAANAAERRVSPALLEALRAINAKLPPSAARERHLTLLGQPGTVVLVTGQQMGLFLGPLFTLYKAAATVAAAKALNAETGRPCVPVFWLQDEDHDLPEIDHTFVPRASGAPLRVSLSLPRAEASRCPVSELRVGPGVEGALQALHAELGNHPHAAEHLALLERTYRPDATLPEAFAELLSHVFADDGLVVVDPREPRVAQLAAPLHRRSIEEAGDIAARLMGQGQALAKAGFAEQVHVRPGAPLGFFSPEGPGGARYRFEPAAGGWALIGATSGVTLTAAELGAHLEQEPLRFTTSALLRPVLQDSLLPTAGYVAGPGEIAYFAQLGPLYEHLGLPMPLVIPRARFRVLDDRSRGLLEKLGLTADEVAQPREALLAKLAAQGGGFEPPEALEARLHAALAPEWKKVESLLVSLDPGLRQALDRTDETVRGGISKLLAKYGRAVGQRDKVTVDRLDRLRDYLTPGDAPQERVHGLAYYACRFGTAGFTARVREACVPFSGELRDLTL